MLIHPQFNPVAIELGPLAVHWYGLSYLLAFALFIYLGFRRVAQPHVRSQGWTRQDVEDLLFLGVLGVIGGGRLGYVLFYKPLYFLDHPIEVFHLWQGGMSFHGGMLGVMVAMAWFAWTRKRHWVAVCDVIAPCVPTGLASGRIGNFINGELWGRAADPQLPWAMVFPQSGTWVPRHPSQLYQVLCEGLILFVLLWIYARKPRGLGQVSAVFLMGYGLARFFAEYFREPDAHLGLLWLGWSMGQWLCVPMVAGGAALWVWGQRRMP